MTPSISYRPNCKCACQRCLVNGLFGPAIIITIGLLLLLSTLRVVDFSLTSPFILIVIGGLLLAKSRASIEGHVSGSACIAPVTVAPPPANSNNSTFYPGR